MINIQHVHTQISPHFYWKRDLTLTSVLLIFLAFTDVVLSPLGIFPSLSKSVELSELAKTFLLLLPSINGIGSNKADLKRFEKSTLETKTLRKQIENTKLYNVISLQVKCNPSIKMQNWSSYKKYIHTKINTQNFFCWAFKEWITCFSKGEEISVLGIQELSSYLIFSYLVKILEYSTDLCCSSTCVEPP